MKEADDEEQLERCAKDHVPTASGNNIGCKDDGPAACLDNKENLYSISSNRYDLASHPRVTTQNKASKKGERNNLRKSIAWNQAFFTDEGVLDPSELSFLCGSAAKSSVGIAKENALGELNGNLTPLKSYEVSTRSNYEVNSSEMNFADAVIVLREKTPFTSQLPEKTPVFKTTSKSMLRAPSNYAVKRAAEINPNTVSKLPKFIATLSHLSSVASSARSNAPTNVPSLHLKTAKTDENSKSKSSLFTLKKDKMSEHAVKKKEVDEDSCLPPQPPMKQIKTLKKPQNHEPLTGFSTKVLEKTEPEILRNSGGINCGQKPSASQPRASGLRMPTPSMGFFSADKSRPLAPKESKGSRVISFKSQLPRPTLLFKPTFASGTTENPISVSDVTKKANCTTSSVRESVQQGQTGRVESSNIVGPIKDRPSAEIELTKNSEYTNRHDPLSECSKEISRSRHSTSINSFPHLEEIKTVQDCSNPVDECSSLEADVTSTSEKSVDQFGSQCAPIEDSSRVPKDASTLLNRLRAAPFSEEWIAALETFGEDILQVKSGAVQNSPTKKANQEPGPWSPVKRKNVDVGPYDCTKYTKNP